MGNLTAMAQRGWYDFPAAEDWFWEIWVIWSLSAKRKPYFNGREPNYAVMLMWRIACAGMHQSLFQLQLKYEKLMHVIFLTGKSSISRSINFICAGYHQLLISEISNLQNYCSMWIITGWRKISDLSCLIARLLPVKPITCRVQALELGCRPQSAVSVCRWLRRNEYSQHCKSCIYLSYRDLDEIFKASSVLAKDCEMSLSNPGHIHVGWAPNVRSRSSTGTLCAARMHTAVVPAAKKSLRRLQEREECRADIHNSSWLCFASIARGRGPW